MLILYNIDLFDSCETWWRPIFCLQRRILYLQFHWRRN